MKNYINLIECQELNSFVDVDKANNGGGYSQPKITYSGYFNNRSIVVTITDTSCGEFGSRYSVEVYYKNTVTKYYYNSMNNHVEEYGNISDDVADFIYQWCNYWCSYDIKNDVSYEDLYIQF